MTFCVCLIPFLRSASFRATSASGGFWAAALFYAIYHLPDPPPRAIVFASLLFPAYYTPLSLWLEYLRLIKSTAND